MHNILANYPVQFRKPAGCGIDYSRLLRVAEKCLCAGRLSGEEDNVGAGDCEKDQKTAQSTEGGQNAGEELLIHTDNRKREICTVLNFSACPQRTEAYAGFTEQG